MTGKLLLKTSIVPLLSSMGASPSPSSYAKTPDTRALISRLCGSNLASQSRAVAARAEFAGVANQPSRALVGWAAIVRWTVQLARHPTDHVVRTPALHRICSRRLAAPAPRGGGVGGHAVGHGGLSATSRLGNCHRGRHARC